MERGKCAEGWVSVFQGHVLDPRLQFNGVEMMEVVDEIRGTHSGIQFS